MKTSAVPVKLTRISQHATRVLRLQFSDLSAVDFDLFWLRDNCPSGFHPETGERTFDLLSLPDDLSLRQAGIDERGHLVLDWTHDGHHSRFSPDWLWAHRPGMRRPDVAMMAPSLWTATSWPEGPIRHQAQKILDSDNALWEWLVDTKRFGLTIVDGLDGNGAASMAVARRVGFLRETNFGLTFEVINKPDPNNLAYTFLELPLHTDLANQELPPGVQFLHCIANDAAGGGSLLADGFSLAANLRQHDPTSFRVLSEVPVPFRFFDSHVDLRTRRSVISLDADGSVREIAFNAHLVDLIDLPSDTAGAWYDAYRAYMRLTRDPTFRLTFKLVAGEMIVFDNRRVLHGREAFDPSTGFRHLHGCYVDRGEFDSRLRMLDNALGSTAEQIA